MIDIIGNIKIDESKPERVKQLIACIRSYSFMAPIAKFVLLLQETSMELVEKAHEEIQNAGFNKGSGTGININRNEYGVAYNEAIKNLCNNEFVLNFMEDQFMMLDNEKILMHLIGFMKQYKADTCKASFYHVEQNSIAGIKPISDVPGLAMVYENNIENHLAYCSHYKERYYIGCNFLTTRDFALKFWNRQLGPRPHPYEVPEWEPAWQHRCVIPHVELQAAIDDDHGEPGTCLLHRPDAKKFWDIYNEL